MSTPTLNPQLSPVPWLTLRRLRAQGFVLLLVIWSVFAWNYSVPGVRDRDGQIKGTDFIHFYTLGMIAREHRGDALYNIAAQQAIAARRIPQAARVRYLPLYPPQVSLLFAPLAGLPYSTALLLWSLGSLATYGLCCAAIVRLYPALQTESLTVAVCAAAYPAFWHLIAWGQTSALALACFVAAYFALRADRRFLAGLALGCLIYKPQLGLAAALVCLLSGEWTLIGGALVSAAIQLAAAWGFYGHGSLLDWMHAILQVPGQMSWLEPRPFQTHCLRTFWSMLLPWPRLSGAMYGISAAWMTIAAVKCWRSRAALELRFSALLLATVLLSPHLTVYDLVVLAPALLLLGQHAAGSANGLLRWLLYLTYALPLIGPLARWTHVQLSVIAMVGLLLWIRSACGPRRLPLGVQC